MTEFETILMCFIIPMFAVLCYIAGKGDVLTLILMMMEEKTKEINERNKEDG